MEREFSVGDFATLRKWIKERPWKHSATRETLLKLRITDGAYPKETIELVEQYISTCQHENDRVQLVLRFALLCVLESISFTRKDGQYLRWDYRSGRRQGARPFDKGEIIKFDKAICAKLEEIDQDLQGGNVSGELFPSGTLHGNIYLFKGSCLDVMPTPLKYQVYLTRQWHIYCHKTGWRLFKN